MISSGGCVCFHPSEELEQNQKRNNTEMGRGREEEKKRSK